MRSHPKTHSTSTLNNLLRGLCVVSAATLSVAACGDVDSFDESEEALAAWAEGGAEVRSGINDTAFDDSSLDDSAHEESSKGSRAATTVCGSTCPSGQHVSADVCTSSCSGWGGIAGCVASGNGNAVRCDPNTGSSFSSCETSCPAGYHNAHDTCTLDCEGFSGIAGCVATGRGNALLCDRNEGASFTTCDASCPPDYAHTADLCSLACDGYTGIAGCVAQNDGNRIRCTFAAGGCAWDPGTAQYCDNCGPCGVGEGLCTENADCEAGLGCDDGVCDIGIADGEIAASPQTVQVTGSTGSTTITAYVEFATNPQIWVSVNGNPRTLFAGLGSLDEQGGSISQTASWIQAGNNYTFTLFENGNGSDVLDTVTVVGEQACTSSEYEYQGSCYPKPVLTMRDGSGGACSNLGVDHGNPDYLVRTTITGRPGATVQIFNRHTSCGAGYEVAPESGAVIPASGVWTQTIESSASSDCAAFGGLYGRWSKYAVVDGQTSNTRNISFYNSQCGEVSTCGTAFNYCEGDGGTTTTAGGDDGGGDLSNGGSDPF